MKYIKENKRKCKTLPVYYLNTDYMLIMVSFLKSREK